MTSDLAVELRDCRKKLGASGAEAVEFRVKEFCVALGERVALTGPSGCGKSTLLNLVSGLVRQDSGSIKVLGTDVASLSTTRMDTFRGASIGFVYQTFNLVEAFTARENVLLGMRFGRAIPAADRNRRADELLDRVGLSHRMHSRPSRLSVGERQRVAIARAIANKPRILLADEPTGALDPGLAEEVFTLLLDVCESEKCALLLVTHDHDLAARLPRRFECRGLVSHRAGGDA